MINTLIWIFQILGMIGSCSGILLNERKNINCWIVWNISNIFWITSYVLLLMKHEPIWFSIITMLIYIVLNTKAYIGWKKNE